jgi:hypothetical protein
MNTIWAVSTDSGCPTDWVGGSSACEYSRGHLYDHKSSGTYTPMNMYGLAEMAAMKNYGFDNEVIKMSIDTVALSYPQSGGQKVGKNYIWEFWSFNYTLQGLVGFHQQPVNLTDLGGHGNGHPSFIQTLRNRNDIPSLSYGYTAGAFNRK